MTADEASKFFGGLSRRVVYSCNWWDWNLKGTKYGDIAVTETKEFPENNTLPGETCWTLEDSWFWFKGTKTKNASEIIPVIRNANSRNANFLLNVGPDTSGKFAEESVEELRVIGKSR
jgi:alpha-L-fucosidase